MSPLLFESLTAIDCALLDARRGLIGETWIVDLELEGDLGARSMPKPASLRQVFKDLIAHEAGHKLMVPQHHAGLSLHRSDDGVALEFRGPADGAIEHRSPAAAVCVIDAGRIDADSIAAHLLPRLIAAAPPGIAALRPRLRSENIAGACYRYTHGIKAPGGHLLRIAHGHRSRIEIRLDGQRDDGLEQDWARRWDGNYLGTQEDVVVDNTRRVRFESVSVDGRLELELPAERCELLDGDTGVEQLAAHIAAHVAAQRRGLTVEVHAYEGVSVGAVARAGR